MIVKGIACPKCGGGSGTVDSRPTKDGGRWRRRQCETCAHRFNTWEIAAAQMPKMRLILASATRIRAKLDDVKRLVEDTRDLERAVTVMTKEADKG